MKEYFERVLREVVHDTPGVPDDFEIETEKPARSEHGDLSTNAAMQLSGILRRSPHLIAESIAKALREKPVDPARIASIEVAGSGFVNVRFARPYLYDSLKEIVAAGETYGRGERLGRKAVVEYVSANPTGPLTVGHGRNAVLGDTVANLLDWTGYDVTREYYYNDAGRQMRVLGESVRARYLAIVNADLPVRTLTLDDGTSLEVPEPFPDEGYLGEYVNDIARRLHDEQGDTLANEESIEPFIEAAEMEIFSQIESTLKRMHVQMDVYFNEHTLFEHGRVGKIIRRLREEGYAYDMNGATWFKTSDFGKTDADGKPADTVLVKSSGEPTYRLPDIAYHETKFERGFDRIVNIFGADHIGTYPDVLRALKLLGYDADRIETVLYQFVTLVQGGSPVKMSTRRASFVTLDELIEEVGADVTRFFFLMRSPNTHLDFDLDLAREASDKNPVYYLQYAHARICSIIRKAEEEDVSFDADPDLTLLEDDAEIGLIKELLRFPDVLERAAEAKEPHQVASYLRDVAVAFTQFYGSCHILGEPSGIASARMQLARAARQVLKNGLTVLGISAPESM